MWPLGLRSTSHLRVEGTAAETLWLHKLGISHPSRTFAPESLLEKGALQRPGVGQVQKPPGVPQENRHAASSHQSNLLWVRNRLAPPLLTSSTYPVSTERRRAFRRGHLARGVHTALSRAETVSSGACTNSGLSTGSLACDRPVSHDRCCFGSVRGGGRGYPGEGRFPSP